MVDLQEIREGRPELFCSCRVSNVYNAGSCGALGLRGDELAIVIEFGGVLDK